MNPYAELDVAVGADAKTIKRAYRRRAKQTHPDTGGDPAAFARAKRASVVLLDPERRRKYDTSGKIDDDSPDNALSEVMQFVVGAIAEAVAAALQFNAPPERCNLIEEATKRLRAKRDELSKNNAATAKMRDYLTAAIVRVTVKKGKENRVAALMRGQLGWVERAIETGEHQKLSIAAALELLAEHGYRLDETRPTPQFRFGGVG